MSIQIFLQGKLLGAESFLAALTQSGEPAGDAVVTGRAYWMTLLSEVLPRALLAELGLAKILLGASGGGSFFVVLPDEARSQAEAFLLAANADIDKLSAGHMRLIWGATENLGDWTIVRKRLTEEVWRREHTSPLASAEGAFSPDAASERYPADEYFTELAATVPGAKLYGWSPELPGGILVDQGKHTWAAGANDGIGIAHHTALDEAGSRRATLEELSARAAGKPRWGVLRGEVDGLQVRLRRTQTIEEYIQLALTFKQFFAGELEVACMMGDFWRKVTVLHSGWGDFAAYGSWDALLQLGRELQRLFHRFAEANLKDLAGPEGKTITMALELAPEVSTPFAYVYEAATRSLATAKTTDRDCLYIFGRTVEWRHVNHASDLKELMLRLVFDLGSPPEFLEELSSFYREKPTGRSDRPWRYHRRLAVVLGEHKDREVQRLEKALITDIVGKSTSQVKLRPAGRVAVEWARLLAVEGRPAQPVIKRVKAAAPAAVLPASLIPETLPVPPEPPVEPVVEPPAQPQLAPTTLEESAALPEAPVEQTAPAEPAGQPVDIAPSEEREEPSENQQSGAPDSTAPEAER